mmetsp:Transcript_7523/g.21495  ORF Transcript_7523/g.21495 Transcript_7523/m.21495 type:complete len:205 (-) Transcript_7523:630-1244(-)
MDGFRRGGRGRRRRGGGRRGAAEAAGRWPGRRGFAASAAAPAAADSIVGHRVAARRLIRLFRRSARVAASARFPALASAGPRRQRGGRLLGRRRPVGGATGAAAGLPADAAGNAWRAEKWRQRWGFSSVSAFAAGNTGRRLADERRRRVLRPGACSDAAAATAASAAHHCRPRAAGAWPAGVHAAAVGAAAGLAKAPCGRGERL